LAILAALLFASPRANAAALKAEFRSPPHPAQPWVYWINMDGHFTREGITADLESMKAAGIGGMIHMDVDVGVPRGKVPFMSETWQENFRHAVLECERLGLEFTTITGPGWTGTGGPWVKADGSMQHLLPVSVNVQGPATFNELLPIPPPRVSGYHSEQTPEMRKTLAAFYEDVAVYAFPRRDPVIGNIDEKALFVRNPYTSMPGVRTHFPSPASFPETGKTQVIDPGQIIDLTGRLQPDGRLHWEVPPGEWTILRMGRRSTGANTRPAPAAGLGFESNKFDPRALESHFEAYFDPLLKRIGPRPLDRTSGFTGLDADSWEMGAQNWTPGFREEFKQRRNYDPWPYFPAYSGRVVGSREMTERFLWDVRMTCQELLLENHIAHLKTLCHARGLKLTIEPYDMTPVSDLDLGSLADIPQGEFWYNQFNSAFSCLEAASIGHILGKPIVAAEAFTAVSPDWTEKPWTMKNQGDWAFAAGINRFVIVSFAHQPWLDRSPGMAFASYGLHWERTQTFWPLLGSYHQYLARCSHLLQQGVTVSDLLYLTPEGAPHVFRAPDSAFDEAQSAMPDKKGYGFDGCSPKILLAGAEVKDGLITFPGGSSYRLLVLAQVETMTPALLAKIRDLVKAGATVVGPPPVKSPSLSDYPACDSKVQVLAKDLWGSLDTPPMATRRSYGKGVIHWGGELSPGVRSSGPDSMSESQWIWYPEGHPAQSAPPGTRYFQRIITVDAAKVLATATASVSADNAFILWINGKKVSAGDNFTVTVRTSITSFLRPGANVIAVAATNSGQAANPAGWIGAFDWSYQDGSREIVRTDGKWSAGMAAQPGWEQTATKPGDWQDALVLGAYAMAPWNRVPESQSLPPLYPSYELAAALLQGMGVPEDFTATGPVRYGHRRTKDRDIYFVSNRTGAPIKASCRFRVGRGRPQLWDPVTGEQQPLLQFERADGLTVIPMVFDAFQSFFVVFGGPDERPISKTARNFPEFKMGQELSGAWEVAFDPKWGGPGKPDDRGQPAGNRTDGKIVFEQLQDWTTRPEAGIKYYSGIATYRKHFNLAQVPAGKTYLDLGVVYDLARVKLNGNDLGVVWCPPWRVEVTGAIQAANNQLEIEVANRWPNRMIGDQQPPAANARSASRYTLSTHEPYHARSALIPSGLLGPVRVLERTPD
jgi:hypothetical protein